jgi:hypothetical protein
MINDLIWDFQYFQVLFLDDYFESAGLGKVNPNFLGMIDQVACTNGDIFVGK